MPPGPVGRATETKQATARHDAWVSAERRLVLVRHAKAASAAGSDRGRSLTARGRSEAVALGGWLAKQVDGIDEVWCSSALRARQTWAAAAGPLAAPPEPDLRDAVYDAGPDDLLEMVRLAAPATRTLVVVGHNPTMERLCAWLTDDDRGFPTCSAAVVAVPGPWSELAPGGGRLTAFRVAR